MRRRIRWSFVAAVMALAPTVAAQTVSHPWPGITLVRQSRRAFAVADLCATGVHVRATAYPERDALASTWATRVGAQIAVNGDLFTYVTYAVSGRARGDGMDWPAADQYVQATMGEFRQYWEFGPGFAHFVPNSMTAPDPAAREVMGGHNIIIQDGHATDPGGKPLLTNAYRHTGIGLSADRRMLYVLASDVAVSGPELAAAMMADAVSAGAPPIDVATNEDGGGSTQMYVAGQGLIVPSTRPVANHLGIVAGGSDAPTSCTPPWAAQRTGQSFPMADSEPPLALRVGQTVDGWFELRNVGTATWHTATTHLGTTGPRDSVSPVSDPGWPSANRAGSVPGDVPPGMTARIAVRLRGNAVGEVTQTFGLVEDGVTWFGSAPLGGGPPDDLLRVDVVVSAADAIDAGLSDASVRDASGSRDAGRTDGSDDGAHGADGGCGCRTTGVRDERRGGMLGLMMLAAAIGSRRRGRRPARIR